MLHASTYRWDRVRTCQSTGPNASSWSPVDSSSFRSSPFQVISPHKSGVLTVIWIAIRGHVRANLPKSRAGPSLEAAAPTIEDVLRIRRRIVRVRASSCTGNHAPSALQEVGMHCMIAFLTPCQDIAYTRREFEMPCQSLSTRLHKLNFSSPGQRYIQDKLNPLSNYRRNRVG